MTVAVFRVLIEQELNLRNRNSLPVLYQLSYANLPRRAATVASNLFPDPKYNTPHPVCAASTTGAYTATLSSYLPDGATRMTLPYTLPNALGCRLEPVDYLLAHWSGAGCKLSARTCDPRLG